MDLARVLYNYYLYTVFIVTPLNIWTGERIPDPPKYPASKQEGKSKDLEMYDE